ncbi:hypothetical protein [Halostreptopolyspora alba]|uniref:Uncharacterized protein n=1 Tax=Halostreptopolyspora alba TaxID=2487137 RepID=A0A3N0EI51_9ACTN|nr:hypothetical protein EFW17_01215 [Nocardiopsaceae bacterium YIM 96095]
MSEPERACVSGCFAAPKGPPAPPTIHRRRPDPIVGGERRFPRARVTGVVGSRVDAGHPTTSDEPGSREERGDSHLFV